MPWDEPDKTGQETGATDLDKLFPIPDLTEKEVFTGVDLRYASGYDNQTRKISCRDQWIQTRDNYFLIGEFRWTAFDYLGESWGWPARTNNYGVIDMADFPKDHYYLYQSFWSGQTDGPPAAALDASGQGRRRNSGSWSTRTVTKPNCCSTANRSAANRWTPTCCKSSGSYLTRPER